MNILFLLLSFSAWAEVETVHLQGNLSFLRCAKEENSITRCSRAAEALQPIKIALSEVDEFGESGEYSFFATQDGVQFEGLVVVTKTPSAYYEVQVFIQYEPANPLEGGFDFIGKARAKDISQLNELIWTGKTVKWESGSITPFLTLSP